MKCLVDEQMRNGPEPYYDPERPNLRSLVASECLRGMMEFQYFQFLQCSVSSLF
jgi:hypothetical protein